MLIGAERRRAKLDQIVHDEDDVAMAAVTLAELLVGVALADDRHRSKRQAFVDALVAVLPIETYDAEVARTHAGLLAHARRVGRPRGAHDLIIAATAIARQREVVTLDASGFADLPGVRLRR
jgi:tRNA(fMet)-specific endonuclease VapC